MCILYPGYTSLQLTDFGEIAMNSIYKRIVTIGMVSITALLAWIYCILEYRHEPIYIICISLIVIISLYALFNSFVSLRIDRDTAIKNYISEAIARTSATGQADGLEDMERISKAMYIQMRKTALTLKEMSEAGNITGNTNYAGQNEEMNKMIADSINRAVRIIVKYNQNNHEGMVLALSDLSENLAKISDEINHIGIASKSSATTEESSASYDDPVSDAASGTVIPFPNDSAAEEKSNSNTDNTNTDTASNDNDEPASDTNVDADPNRTLSPDEIAALFASAMEQNNQ